MRRQTTASAAILPLLLALATLTPPLQAAPLPPAWRTNDRALYPDDGSGDAKRYDAEHAEGRRRRTTERPWYIPRAALGVGLNVPELVPVEGWLFFGRYFGLRAFYTPPMPFKIRVEMPSDVISAKNDVAVANPDFTIHMRAVYGAHYGLEALAFPWGGSFFLAGGVSRRRMQLTGDAKSPILVCSLIEAAKEPPCPDPDARIETATQLEIKASVETTAILARASLGWFWHVGRFGYFMLNAGATKPTHVHRSVHVETAVDTPSSDDTVSAAVQQVKTERERDLEDKAVVAMRPVDQKTLPILGIAAGIRF